MRNRLAPRTWRMTIYAALAVAGTLSLPAANVVAASAITFNVYMGKNCVGGTAGQPNRAVHITWTRSTGAVVAGSAAITDENSEWLLCVDDGSYVEPADTIKVQAGSSQRAFV